MTKKLLLPTRTVYFAKPSHRTNLDTTLTGWQYTLYQELLMILPKGATFWVAEGILGRGENATLEDLAVLIGRGLVVTRLFNDTTTDDFARHDADKQMKQLYYAKISPLYELTPILGKSFLAYTQAHSINQAQTFLIKRYPYPKFLVAEPRLDQRGVAKVLNSYAK